MTDPNLNAVITLANNLGVSRDELVDALANSNGGVLATATAPKLRIYVEAVSSTISAGSMRGYGTHLRRLCDGVPRQCECTCTTCVAQFHSDGCCACTCRKCASAISFPALGDLPVTKANFTRTTIEPLVTIARRMATKRAMVHNRSRQNKGLPPKHVHGQGGQEMCVSALRMVLGRAVDDGLLATNPAQNIAKGERSEPVRRALVLAEIEVVFEEVVTGGDDPELDFGIVWSIFETAGRRGGLLHATVGSILGEAQAITLHEKQNRQRQQPISAELIDYLLAMAAQRGGTRCVPSHPDYDPQAPLFYYRDSTPERPHPLTAKRFETLFGRIQRRFPWAAETQFSAHALRHTTATLVERNFTNQVARKYLGHSSRSATDEYTKASYAEVVEAFSTVIGFAHPEAPDAR